MNVTFQPAQSADADVIFSLAQNLVHCFEDPSIVDIPKVEQWMQCKIRLYIQSYQRILLGDTVVGYFRLEDQDGYTELDDFYILPEYRGQGIGTQVIRHCLQAAEYPVYFYVFSENHRAMSFYQRCGFEVFERVSVSRVIMRQKVDS